MLSLTSCRENIHTGVIRDVDPDQRGKQRREMRRRISLRSGQEDLTIVDYTREWEQHQQERELDRKRRVAAVHMQRLFR